MRWFKLLDGHAGVMQLSIWKLREDGMEKCIWQEEGHVNGWADPDSDWIDWTDPTHHGEETLVTMMQNDGDHITEITEEDAFLEMI